MAAQRRSPLQPEQTDEAKGNAPAEAALVQVLAGLLRDPVVNPHQGSVSLDKLKLLASQHAGEVYRAVVEAGGGDKPALWRGLIRRHQDILSLVRRRARLKRVYLTGNQQWLENDQSMRSGLAQQEEYILGCLEWLLEQHRAGGRGDSPLGLQQFIEAYPRLAYHGHGAGENVPELPPRGDLARLLRRHRYEVDSGHYIVGPADEALGCELSSEDEQ